MLENSFAASQAFWAILDKTTGIRPDSDDANDSDSPDIEPYISRPLTRRAKGRPHAPDPHLLPPLPSQTFASDVESVQDKRPARTDSGYGAKQKFRAPLVLSDVMDEEAEGMFEDLEVDPWEAEDLTWSDEAHAIKQLYHRHQMHMRSYRSSPNKAIRRISLKTAGLQQFSESYILGFFRTVRLHSQKIGSIDEAIKRMKSLEELSLTGNWIETVENLPKCLQILHLNANRYGRVVAFCSSESNNLIVNLLTKSLTKCPDLSHLHQLVHFGIGYNTIQTLRNVDEQQTIQNRRRVDAEADASIRDSGPPTLWLPPSLMSLDVSWNLLSDLEDTIEILAQLPRLRALALLGNPLCLLPTYRAAIIIRLPRLISLDDVPTNNVEPVELDTQKHSVQILFAIHTLNNPSMPILPTPQDPTQPLDQHTFQIRIAMSKHNLYTTLTAPVVAPPQQSPDEKEKGKGRKKKEAEHQASEPEVRELDLGYEKVAQFPADDRIRDAVWDGVTFTLIRTHMTHVLKTDTRPPSSAMTSRRTSLTSATGKTLVKKASKGAKKKVSREDEEGLWMPVTVESVELGSIHISLKSFLEGENIITGHYPVGPSENGEDAPQTIVHATIKLNPSEQDVKTAADGLKMEEAQEGEPVEGLPADA